jgi:superfamily II DNA or RNA helicase
VIELPSLYDHQEQHKDRVRNSLGKHGRIIMCAPTGCGKTRMAKWILGSSGNRKPSGTQSGRSLFAVHRRGLVDNAQSSFAESPELPHGLIMSGREPSYGNRVQVASIDTMLSWFIENDAYRTDITFDLIVFDECVSGDAMVDTDVGRIRLDEIPVQAASMVKTYSKEKGVHYARILNWMHKGQQDTLEVHTNAGKIQCTPDHEIYTRRGWLQAQYLSPTDEILACVDAEVAQRQDAYFVGDTSKGLLANNWNLCGNKLPQTPRHVRAVAVNLSGQPTGHLRRGIATETRRDTTSTQTGILGARVIKSCNSVRLSVKRYWERCWEIRPSGIRTMDRKTRGCIRLMDTSKRNGRNTKRSSSIGLMQKRASRKTTDGATCQSVRQHRATLASLTYTKWLPAKERNEYQKSGSTRLATSDSRGGFVTMAQLVQSRCSSIPKGFLGRKTKQLQSGFVTTLDGQPLFRTKRKEQRSSTSQVGRRSKSAGESSNSFQSACGTSWCRVTKIVVANQTDVYDIEVEKSHCFFANNLLVHNCHSHHSKLATFLKYHDAQRESMGLTPAFVIGLSATPQAEGLADLYREIVKGPETQWLIDNEYLSPMRYFRATQGKLDKLVKRAGDFTNKSQAEAMDGLAGDLVRDWRKYADGRPTIGFFPRIAHAKDAMEQLRADGIRTAYVDGSTPDDERRQIFHALNNGHVNYLANCQVVERGTDIPAASCIQLCVAVGSVSRYRQMIGRGARVHPTKTDCLILDHGGNVQRHGFFEDDPEWSLDITTKEAGEVGTKPTIECPQCQAIYRGGKCRACGYEPTATERRGVGLEFDGSELKEVTRKEKTQPAAKSAEQLMISALYMSGKSGRTWRQACGIFRGMNQKQGTAYYVPKSVTVGGVRYQMLRSDSTDTNRRVSTLFPFTVGARHGGNYRVNSTETTEAPY